MHVCTIVARNYLPQARVLSSSVRAVHDDARVTVLVVDDLAHEVDGSREPFEVIGVEDLEGDAAELRRMAAIYNVLEYSTALKPWLLRTLLERGSSTVTYLDPDIRVFHRLDEVEALAREHDLVLTPHVTSPMPRDGRMISETDILAAGIFNLGFIAVSERSHALLDYWSERLKRECVVDPQRMRFVDQRWVDFAPGIYDVAILREPGYNVAYWNLDHRKLTWDGEGYEVTGKPLYFFHFSGYSPRAPHLLSKHQAHPPRILLSEHPTIRQMCREYGDLLVANGFYEVQGSYGLERMANGIPIDDAVRRLYRDAVVRADAGERAYPEDPFSSDGAGALLSWMNEVAEVNGGPARLTRYFAAKYACRGDLQAAYPDVQASDFGSFMSWARNEVALGRIDRRLLPSEANDGPYATTGRPFAFAPPDQLRPGFTVIGYFKAELGVGEWGRLATEAIAACGIPHATVTTTKTTSRQEHPFEGTTTSIYNFDTNLLCVNADQVPFARADLGPECFSGRYTIGQWAWELEEFPERWSGSFDLVDEVWAISEFTRKALSRITTTPVYSVPPAIVEPRVPGDVDRIALGIPRTRFIFLFAFDLLSILERKNPLGLIEAFCRAFPEPHADGPMLVLKVINGDQRLADLERIRFAVDGREDILVIDRYFGAEQQVALMAQCDCYVSLHRSEGFGLTMAEAMALGKPVIATAYSGNMDFMDSETALLVRWSDGKVPEGCEPYREGARWAEPDLDHAAELLRWAFENPSGCSEIGGRARRTVLEQHSPSSRAEVIRQRFETIQRDRAEAILSSESETWSGEGTLRRLAAARPSLGTPAKRAATLTRFYRRVVLRAQRHHDDHQRRVNVALAENLEALREQFMSGAGAFRRELADLRMRSDESARQSVEWKTIQNRLQAVESALVDASKTLRSHEETMGGLQKGIEDLESGGISDLFQMGGQLQDQIQAVRARLDELHSVPYMRDPAMVLTNNASGRPAIGYHSESAHEGTYAGFEDLFRGSEGMIRERQRVYVPMLRGHSPIVDVGCGRGEMLDLLETEGVKAVGIDPDQSMVDRCRAKGHHVELADVDTYLATCVEGSLGAVFSAQVIEHLSYDELLRFFAGSYRVLEEGGVFIAETVNPHSVPAFKTFWTDLTHRAPIFPEVAVTLCRSAGFEEAEVIFPNGVGDLETDRWREGEYAVVATKRGC